MIDSSRRVALTSGNSLQRKLAKSLQGGFVFALTTLSLTRGVCVIIWLFRLLLLLLSLCLLLVISCYVFVVRALLCSFVFDQPFSPTTYRNRLGASH